MAKGGVEKDGIGEEKGRVKERGKEKGKEGGITGFPFIVKKTTKLIP